MEEMEIRHQRVPGAGGITLHVAGAGEGPPVVLLHGFPEHWYSWRHQIPALARAGFTALAPDLRGYNRSDRPRRRDVYRLRHLVDDVAALVRGTGHARAHVVGHDWGGIVAWTFAGEYPELLDRLVVLNAPHLRLFSERVWYPPQLLRSWYVGFFQLPWLPEQALSAGDFRAIRRMFRGAAARRDAYTDAEIERFVEPLRQPGALTAALDYYRANLAPGAMRPGREARTGAETLVLWGERDPALVVELLDDVHQVAPRARVVRFPDVGHWIQSEAPEQVNRELVGFLSG